MKNVIARGVAALAITLGALAVGSCSSAPPPRPTVDVEEERFTYQNGSLWPGKSKKNMFFADNKARAVGDIVTVHILEKTTAINKANTTDERNLENSISVDTGSANPTRIKLGGGAKFKGNGATGRSDQFSATISCVVKEVLANGNMLIEGQRRMQINNEEQYIVVRGIIRPDDITYNNEILSTKLADADIMYTGAGAMNGARQPSLLGRALKSIWPF